MTLEDMEDQMMKPIDNVHEDIRAKVIRFMACYIKSRKRLYNFRFHHSKDITICFDIVNRKKSGATIAKKGDVKNRIIGDAIALWKTYDIYDSLPESWLDIPQPTDIQKFDIVAFPDSYDTYRVVQMSNNGIYATIYSLDLLYSKQYKVKTSKLILLDDTSRYA